VRYGSLVGAAYTIQQSPHFLENMYAELDQIASTPGKFPASEYGGECSTAAGYASAAFWQEQASAPNALPAGSINVTPAYTAAPKWFRGDQPSPTATCAAIAIPLPEAAGTSPLLGDNELEAALTRVSTLQSVPLYLVTFSKISGADDQVGASMAYFYTDPSTSLYCSPAFTDTLAQGLGPVVVPDPVGYAGITPAPAAVAAPTGC
jgi:hypothetical protein